MEKRGGESGEECGGEKKERVEAEGGLHWLGVVEGTSVEEGELMKEVAGVIVVLVAESALEGVEEEVDTRAAEEL